MTNGWTMLGIATAICFGNFVNEWRFARMTKNPFAGKCFLGMPVEGYDLSVEKIRWFGHLMMVFSPLFLCFFAALCFGLPGPVAGISPIQF